MSGRLIIRMLVFFTIALSIVVGLHSYIGVRLLFDSGAPQWARVLGIGVMAVGLLSIVGGFASSRLSRHPAVRVLTWAGYLWMSAFVMLLVAVAATDVLRLVLPWRSESMSVGQLQAITVAVIVVPALIIGFRTARGPAKIERVEVPIANLPPQFDGFQIAQISDVHIGPTLDRAFMKRIVDQVNALEPDVVAVTGDLVDGTVAQLRPHVQPLEELKPKLKSFFVTGNHEYYSGGPLWEAEVARMGLRVLHNEHEVIERDGAKLVIAGVTDHEAGQFGESHACRPDLAFADAPEGEDVRRILLAHQPRTAKRAAPFKVDLQLSGHTHGGQFFPWMFFVRLQQPAVSGMKTVHGVRVYTSRGTGYWGPPLRLGPTPEITLLTLRRA